MNMTNRVFALYKYYKLTDEMVRYNFYRCTTFLFFFKNSFRGKHSIYHY
nr:MAG TPA: hypothetical protein [Caudoviricetes sp.]